MSVHCTTISKLLLTFSMLGNFACFFLCVCVCFLSSTHLSATEQEYSAVNSPSRYRSPLYTLPLQNKNILTGIYRKEFQKACAGPKGGGQGDPDTPP